MNSGPEKSGIPPYMYVGWQQCISWWVVLESYTISLTPSSHWKLAVDWYLLVTEIYL